MHEEHEDTKKHGKKHEKKIKEGEKKIEELEKHLHVYNY